MPIAPCIATVLLLGGVTAGAATQPDPPIVFARVCNMVRGQEANAEALAREMATLVNERYPGAEMAVETGRWMTGFQSLENPVDQIRFIEEHADPDTRDAFSMLLIDDDDLAQIQQRLSGVLDLDTCTETQSLAAR